ncbi:DELLA protein RGL1-like [Momordica charantia]|uniref:DELLA protein RGL1-like n=1 Tax=Momordica charantia TaxID=3673 RepID=A0A6J1C1U4_MOMCH|nr:DELLA protein RGL1-like [Momordica charantia]
MLPPTYQTTCGKRIASKISPNNAIAVYNTRPLPVFQFQFQLPSMAPDGEGSISSAAKEEEELTLSHRRHWLSMLDDTDASRWVISFSDEIKYHKRSKLEPTDHHDAGGTGSSSLTLSRSGSSDSLTTGLGFRAHIWTYNQRYLAAEAVEEAAAAIINAEETAAEDDASADGMRLLQLLVACAEAVACRDRAQASILLSQLRASALVFGSSFQRVASCFVQGLADRLALVQPLGYVGFGLPIIARADHSSERKKKEEALNLVYEIYPHIQFGHFVANSSILEVFEGENSVHVVDLGMAFGLPYGHQWRSLIESLAEIEPPRRLRVTGIGLSVNRYRVMGEKLKSQAEGVGIQVEITVVEGNLENLRPQDINLHEGEALVIASIFQMHCVVKESRGALTSVLRMIYELSPKALVLVEQDSNHNGPFFLGRFMEALHYYSAIFDSLDAMLPKYDTRRAKIEQFYFAEEIKNIVSCEGMARVERHERVDQWRRRMSRAGFQAAPTKMMAQAKQWIGKFKANEGYTVVEEKGCLVLGWKSKPIVAASCWKC